MCGIFGIYSLSGKRSFDTDLVMESLFTMKHRGPDAQDFKIFNEKVCLGHLRLSIIDLKPESNQPFCIDDRYWITYNGEIYNYIELRDELKKEFDISFKTKSDTEVLLRAYQFWGEECVKRFNGMWAFAIFDSKDGTLFCSRDRFGVKPFNYAVHDQTFIFGSEIKPILKYFDQLKVPNYNVIANFCRTSTGAQINETWFQDILRLAPGSNLVIKDTKINIYKYWRYPVKVNYDINLDSAVEHYKNLFLDAVKLRLRSDVPVGTTLSSGLDSGSIVSTVRTLTDNEHFTFTAKFDESNFEGSEKSVYATNVKIDEASIVLDLAKKLSLSAEMVNIKYGEFVSDLRNIIHYLESGNSSPATFPLMQVMENAKKKITVVLEGQGADELLLGYLNPLFFSSLFVLIKNFKFGSAYRFYKSFVSIYSLRYAFMLYMRSLLNTNSLVRTLYKWVDKKEDIYGDKLKNYTFIKDYPDLGIASQDPINTHLIRQHSGGLVNLLHYGDAVSMAHSLESRLPFMDYRLVEFVFSLPWHFKVYNNLTKYIHRLSMKGIVPDMILNNPLKFGFNSPLSDKFKYSESFRSESVQILLSQKCKERRIFNSIALEKLIIEHNNDKINHGPLLFRLLSVELWFREFIDGEEN